MAQRVTDGDVALDGHAGEVDGCVARGEDGQQDEEAAEGDVDLVVDIAEDEEHDGDGQLDRIVDNHVDEEDVAGVFVEHLQREEKHHVSI